MNLKSCLNRAMMFHVMFYSHLEPLQNVASHVAFFGDSIMINKHSEINTGYLIKASSADVWKPLSSVVMALENQNLHND